MQRTVDIDFPSVTDVRHVSGHTLWLRFSDGVEGRIDFADWLDGEAFARLRDPALFAQVRLAPMLTIEWPNGVDIAPEALYDRLEVTGSVAKRPYAQLFDDAMKQEAAEVAAMPEISRFLGMVIHMFWTEHEAPHFHATYAEYVASIDIRTGAVTTRRFPERALRHLRKWRKLHQEELLANWERIRLKKDPLPIAPLE